MDDTWKIITSAIGAVIAALLSLLVSYRTMRRSKEATIEGISLKLLDNRVEPYTKFMTGLAPFSKQAFLGEKDEAAKRQRAELAVQYFNEAIYGPIGLLASYESREVLVCARARFRAYAKGMGDFDAMIEAIWGLHQLLRADLNLRQPGMRREIEHIHTHVSELMMDDIVRLIKKVPHIDWERSNG